VLADDLVALTEVDGSFLVQPGYPRVNLWPESASALFGSRHALPRITPTWDKCYLALGQNGYTFGSNPLPLAAVYLLCDRQGKSAAIVEEFGGNEAFMSLVANTHGNYLLDRSMRTREFEALGRLVSRVPIRRVWPADDPSAVRNLCESIAADAIRLTAHEGPLAAARSR